MPFPGRYPAPLRRRRGHPHPVRRRPGSWRSEAGHQLSPGPAGVGADHPLLQHSRYKCFKDQCGAGNPQARVRATAEVQHRVAGRVQPGPVVLGAEQLGHLRDRPLGARTPGRAANLRPAVGGQVQRDRPERGQRRPPDAAGLEPQRGVVAAASHRPEDLGGFDRVRGRPGARHGPVERLGGRLGHPDTVPSGSDGGNAARSAALRSARVAFQSWPASDSHTVCIPPDRSAGSKSISRPRRSW